MRAIKQAILDAFYSLYFWFKYEKLSFIYFNILFLLFLFLRLYLTGSFVKKVKLYGIEVSYVKFLILSFIFVSSFYTIYYTINRRRFKPRWLFSESIFVPIISASICESIKWIIILILFLAIFDIFLVLPFLINLLFSITFGIFVKSFNLVIRGEDFRPFIWIIDFLISVGFSAFYSFFLVVPKQLWFLAYIFPNIAALELMRFYIFIRIIRYDLLIASIIALLFWLVISLKTFEKLFEISRKRGLICLV